MVNYDILAYYIGSNILVYMLIHIPLDLITYRRKTEGYKEDAKDYPAWEDQNFTKIITVITSLVFWVFVIFWPILHIFDIDDFILFFNFAIPYVDEVFQIIGLVLVGLGTFIASIGRISRSTKAISWGVPKELTKKWGFRIVRHPLYASYCYYFIGIPLAMLNYLLIPLILGIFGYYLTAVYEEKILVREFGEEYIEYQKKVGMLVPFIGRRKAVTPKEINGGSGRI